jgi:hypothetical protein
MSIEAHSCSDFPVAEAIAAAGGGHIETGLSQYHGVIPFWDNELRHAVFARDLISS